MKILLSYAGYQPREVIGGRAVGGFRLFNLLEPIPGHPKGSTVSEITLKQLGIEMPMQSEECKSQN